MSSLQLHCMTDTLLIIIIIHCQLRDLTDLLLSFIHSFIHCPFFKIQTLHPYYPLTILMLLTFTFTIPPHYYYCLLLPSFFIISMGPSSANKVNFGLIEVYPNLNRYIQVFKEVYFTCNNAYINSLEAF